MVPDGSGQTALPPDTKPPNYPDLPGKVRIANTALYYSKYRANMLIGCQNKLFFQNRPAAAVQKRYLQVVSGIQVMLKPQSFRGFFVQKQSRRLPRRNCHNITRVCSFLVFPDPGRCFPARCQINNLPHTHLQVSATNRKIFCSMNANYFAPLESGFPFR